MEMSNSNKVAQTAHKHEYIPALDSHNEFLALYMSNKLTLSHLSIEESRGAK